MRHRALSITLVGCCLAVAGYLVRTGESNRALLGSIYDRLDLTLIGDTLTRSIHVAELTDCWTYGVGPVCAQKTVTTTQEPGESLDDFQDRHDALVAAQMKRYPPKEDS